MTVRLAPNLHPVRQGQQARGFLALDGVGNPVVGSLCGPMVRVSRGTWALRRAFAERCSQVNGVRR